MYIRSVIEYWHLTAVSIVLIGPSDSDIQTILTFNVLEA